MRPPRRLTTRKLLVASLGVAAISYIGCSGNPREEPPVSGNLMPPPPPPMDAGSAQVETVPTETSAQPTSKPLVAATPQPSASAVATPKPRTSGSAAVPSLPIKTSPVVGNLMPPRLPDAPKK